MSQNPSGPMEFGQGRPTGRADVDISATFVSPFDRVRWGPIIAGLFVALSLIVLLSVLGLAVGLSTYETGESGRAHVIGSGVWGIVVMVLAFFFGGWIASRSAAVRGWPSYGLLQGFLVWAVAIPLFIYFLAGAVSTFVGPAAQIATAGGERPIRAYMGQGQGPSASTEVTAMSPEERQQALHAGRRAAWTTFVSLVVGLGAAAVGGYVGSTGQRDERYMRESKSVPPPMA